MYNATVVSIDSALSQPPSEWSMSAKISMRQATPEDDLTLHWRLTVRRAKNDVGEYTQLDNNMYLQTFL